MSYIIDFISVLITYIRDFFNLFRDSSIPFNELFQDNLSFYMLYEYMLNIFGILFILSFSLLLIKLSMFILSYIIKQSKKD